MAFRDLRDALVWIRERGLLLEVEEELSPVYDAASLLFLAGRRFGKAILLRNLFGHRVPVVGNVAYDREVIARGMGVAPEDLVRALRARQSGRMDPKEVGAAEAPVLRVSVPKVDLGKAMPILTHYAGDSGPFITSGLISARDPETGAIARGIHRMGVRGADRLGAALMNPPLADVYTKAKALGQRLPVAVTVGLEPVVFVAAAQSLPPATDKLSVAGSLRGEPVEVVAAPLTGIPVPARAEFLLEGELDPADEGPDGPLGEVTGYYLAFPRTPALHVRGIHHRPDPLYHALLPTGREVDVLLAVVGEASLVPAVRDLFPFVAQVHFVPGTFGTSVAVSVAETAKFQVRSLLVHLLSVSRIKKVVVVADDVSPHDPLALEWSIATRCQPDRDVVVIGDLKGTAIDPSCPEPFRTAKIGIDATGFERVKEWKPAKYPPPSLSRAERILERIADA